MHQEFIQKLTNLVEANLHNEQFGVSQLAREMGMSRTNLHRKIKLATNTSVSQFICQVRLKKALELLRQNTTTISETAYQCGFHSVTYFNKCFHEYFGHAPGELRNQETDNKPEEKQFEPVPKKDQRPKILIGLLIGLIAVIPISFFLINKGSFSKEKSIAVLPFINDSHDSTNVYFINGLTETINDKLAQINDLKVTSRNSAEKYRNNKSKSTPQIARELKVRYILEGSGQKIGDSILVSVQLIEARNDKHILSRQFTAKFENVLNLYNEIALDVASEIKALITPEEKQLIRKTPTSNIAAYNMHLRGQELYKAAESENNIELYQVAQDYFIKAIKLDSSYADPYVKLGWIVSNTINNYDSALFLADRALHFDNKNADAFYLKGWIFAWHSAGMDKVGEKEFKHAIRFNPNNSLGYFGMADVFMAKMDYPMAIKYKLKALQREREPYLREIYLTYFCYDLYNLAFFNEGLKFANEMIKVDNDSLVFYQGLIASDMYKGNYLAAYRNLLRSPEDNKQIDCLWNKENICLYLGDYKSALKFIDDGTAKIEEIGGKISPDFHWGYIYLKNGQKEKAAFHFKDSIKYQKIIIEQNHPGTMCNAYLTLACIYSAMGEKAKAIENLKKVLEYKNEIQIFPSRIIVFRNHPIYDTIRDTPELQEILKIAEEKFLPVKYKIEMILKNEDFY